MAGRRELLEMLRDRLNGAIPGAEAKDLPGLSRELRLVLAELDGIPSAHSDAPADEIGKRREERRRQAGGS